MSRHCLIAYCKLGTSYVTKSTFLFLPLPPGEAEPGSTRAPFMVGAAAPDAGDAEPTKAW